MDLNNDTGEAEDRISKLPDSILHDILSFLDIKPVAQTSVLSKRWRHIWTSIPTLKFPVWHPNKPPSLPEINKFMDFVDKTLYFHDGNIQMIRFDTNEHFNASRVHSWISIMTKYKIQILLLQLDLKQPFFVPLSLFTFQSLIELELSADNDTTLHLPKTFSFPKLKTLRLSGIQFTDDNSWNEQHFSECPVLEHLTLIVFSWLGVRKLCISIPTLKRLELDSEEEDEGFGDCALEINAPNLVSLVYSASLAKDYDFTTFQSLKSAKLYIYQDVVVPSYVAAVNKFIRALSGVRILNIYGDAPKVLSIVNILPTFHDLVQLFVDAESTDELLFSLLKAVPNLRSLYFGEGCISRGNIEEEHSLACHMLTSGCMFRHLKFVSFHEFFPCHARHMRWLKLILKNAKVLETVILCLRRDDVIDKEVLMSELLSLPRASNKCEFELEE